MIVVTVIDFIKESGADSPYIEYELQNEFVVSVGQRVDSHISTLVWSYNIVMG